VKDTFETDFMTDPGEGIRPCVLEPVDRVAPPPPPPQGGGSLTGKFLLKETSCGGHKLRGPSGVWIIEREGWSTPAT